MDKKKFFRMNVLMLFTAFLLCIICAGVFISANAADEPKTTVEFDASTDTLNVKLGDTGYYFYTTANAKKSVPKANQWIRTNNGTVDVSSYTGGKTLYFANTSTPAMDDIVSVNIPSSPVLCTAKYNAAEDSVEDMFTFQMNVKIGKMTKKVNVPKSRIQVKLNDNASWGAFSEKITDDTLPGIQKTGGTIYVRISPSSSTTVDCKDGVGYTLADNGKDKFIEQDSSLSVRYGISKTVKITQKKAGPVPVIDYANHAMTIKKGQSYGKSDSTFTPIASKDWEEPDFEGSSSSSKVFFGVGGDVASAEYYCIKTNAVKNSSGKATKAESLSTYITVPPTYTFAQTGSAATVQGGFGENATLMIKDKAGKKNVAYQYAIVDTDTADSLIDEVGRFDYETAASKEYKSLVPWKTVKTDKTGLAKVAIKWNSVVKQDTEYLVMVRKSATGTEFSSSVEVFKTPTGQGIATYSEDEGMPEINCWTKLTQADYGTVGFAGNNTKMEFCANIDNPVYNASEQTITFYVIGGTDVSDLQVNGKDMLTLAMKVKGKQVSYDLRGSGAVVAEPEEVRTEINKQIFTADNYKVTIDLEAVGLPESNTNKPTLTVMDGYASGVAEIPTLVRKSTLNIDNKPLSMDKNIETVISDTDRSSKTFTITLTFDSKLYYEGEELENDASVDTDLFKIVPYEDEDEVTYKIGNLGDAVYTLAGKNKKPTLTLTFEGTVNVSKSETITVTLPAFKDMAGNGLTEESAEIIMENPFY